MANQATMGGNIASLITVGALAWVIPGGGYFALGDRRRGAVVLVTIALTFFTGLYIGSIGVIDSIRAKPWYIAQIMNTPAVILIGNHVADQYLAAQEKIRQAHQTHDPRAREAALEMMRKSTYGVYGHPNEIGQIYTSISGLLNLLCIVNAMYVAHTRANPVEEA